MKEVSAAVASPPLRLGRYVAYDVIASGGMASVHLGALLGDNQFTRLVALKRLHPHYMEDPEFVAMFMDEARLASRIRSPNVVSVLDVVRDGSQLMLVMEYVHGAALSRLIRASIAGGKRVPQAIASAITLGLLTGLHAAHEATDEAGNSLELVHRDVSPQNVMVGVDGVARVVDFGVAKATTRSRTTTDGRVRGKFAYMAPEQMRGKHVTRSADIYSAAVVLWELLTGRRLYDAANEAALIEQALHGRPARPSSITELSAELDELVLRGLAKMPGDRFSTAFEMASALQRLLPPATTQEVATWVRSLCAEELAQREALMARIEAGIRLSPSVAAAVVEDATGRAGALEHDATGVRPRARRPTLLSLGALFGGLALAVAAWTLRPADFVRAPAGESHSAATSSGTTPVGATATTILAPPAETLPPVDPLPPLAPVASARRGSAKATRPAARQPSAKAKPSCDPPFTLDSKGHKHFKVECL